MWATLPKIKIQLMCNLFQGSIHFFRHITSESYIRKQRHILKDWKLFYKNMVLLLFHGKLFTGYVSKKSGYLLVYLSNFYCA